MTYIRFSKAVFYRAQSLGSKVAAVAIAALVSACQTSGGNVQAVQDGNMYSPSLAVAPNSRTKSSLHAAAIFAEAATRSCSNLLMIRTSLRSSHSLILASAYSDLGNDFVERKIEENDSLFKYKLGCDKAAFMVFKGNKDMEFLDLTDYAKLIVAKAASDRAGSKVVPLPPPQRELPKNDGVRI